MSTYGVLHRHRYIDKRRVQNIENCRWAPLIIIENWETILYLGPSAFQQIQVPVLSCWATGTSILLPNLSYRKLLEALKGWWYGWFWAAGTVNNYSSHLGTHYNLPAAGPKSDRVVILDLACLTGWYHVKLIFGEVYGLLYTLTPPPPRSVWATPCYTHRHPNA